VYSSRSVRVIAILVLTAPLALAAGCNAPSEGPAATPSRSVSTARSGSPSSKPRETHTHRPHRSHVAPGEPADTVQHVVVVSVDGLNPTALDEVDQGDLPSFQRLVTEGSSTLNARTEYEMTVTLPNHTSMMTGRPIDRRFGGHGVRIDVPTNQSVQDFAGEPVSSVFDVVHDAGGATALFASKNKFDLYKRSWPDSIDRYAYMGDNSSLVEEAMAGLRRDDWEFTFIHLSGPDAAGHQTQWLSQEYLSAVKAADSDLQVLLDGIAASPQLATSTVLVVTTDHGGAGSGHSDSSKPADYTIPFFVWGSGVAHGKDLYELNPDYRDPGQAQPRYGQAPPIRNGDVANLATALLGLSPVPGSSLDAAQNLVATVR